MFVVLLIHINRLGLLSTGKTSKIIIGYSKTIFKIIKKVDETIQIQEETKYVSSRLQNKRIEIKQQSDDDCCGLENEGLKVQQETENDSLIVTNDQSSNLPSHDVSKDIPDDEENWTIEEKSVRQKTAMEIVFSFVLNVRAVFDEVFSISCK